jgi:hypothetical protein
VVSHDNRSCSFKKRIDRRIAVFFGQDTHAPRKILFLSLGCMSKLVADNTGIVAYADTQFSVFPPSLKS